MTDVNSGNQADVAVKPDFKAKSAVFKSKLAEQTEEKRPYGAVVDGRTLSICLINPRFEPSYWGFEYALPMYPGN